MPRRQQHSQILALLLASATLLTACGTSTSDAEQAILDHSSLTDPACDTFDRDFDELSFACSAAKPGGNRIKLMVDLNARDENQGLV
jgi:ABC-type glycerol-3-phosphate transport system substrate-binding protein